ncbi:MAG TPA: DUF362 domain-containing protein [Gemmatimonadales bacterium]|nr:DUF362 domain-containing protein [Gemmatimonadales bacterium]
MPRQSRPIPRRDFLRTSAGIALLPYLPGGFFVPAARRRSRVVVVRTSDRRVGVTEGIRLFDPAGIAGKRVVLKPNLNSADPAPASTHPDTLGQLVTELHERDARSVTLGESSGPSGTRHVMEQYGVLDLATALRFDVVDLDELPDADWIPFHARGTHWPAGYHLPRLVTDAEYVVSTCCLKTHGYGGVFTMSLKLAVGLTPRPIRRSMHRSPDMRRMIAELNAGYRPRLVVLDGVSAFTDGGPSSGEQKAGNVVIVGDDRVAVDAVGLAVLKDLGANDAIMSRGIWAQEQLARAVELNLGARGPGDIELVTGDAASRAYVTRLERILAAG